MNYTEVTADKQEGVKYPSPRVCFFVPGIIFLSMMTIFTSACVNPINNRNPTTEQEGNPIVQVYNVGYSYASGNLDISYWVNGSRKTITIIPAAFFVGKRGNYGLLQAITVSNGKIYVAGNGFWWNNSGSIHELSFPPNTNNASQSWASAQAITVFNGNVYMAGYNWEPVEMNHITGPYFDDKQRACIWINEKVFNFSDNTVPSAATAITVSEGVIFTAGHSFFNDNAFRGCYWVDLGVAQVLQVPDGYNYSMPKAITVYNKKIYTAGSYGFQQYSEQACYWKNSEIILLPIPTNTTWSQANAIAVVDDKIFVSGFYCEGNPLEYTKKACYWEDGKFYDLHPAGTKYSFSNAIAVLNDTVFVAGVYNEFLHDHVAYWKDGIICNLGIMEVGFHYESLPSFLVIKDN